MDTHMHGTPKLRAFTQCICENTYSVTARVPAASALGSTMSAYSGHIAKRRETEIRKGLRALLTQLLPEGDAASVTGQTLYQVQQLKAAVISHK